MARRLDARWVKLFSRGSLVQGKPAQKTKTIVEDLLEIDRDLYIVRGERGEIQVKATYKTEVTEEFKFGGLYQSHRQKKLSGLNDRTVEIR